VTDNSAETRQSNKQDRENQSVQQNYSSNNDKYLYQSVHKCRTSKIDCTRKKNNSKKTWQKIVLTLRLCAIIRPETI